MRVGNLNNMLSVTRLWATIAVITTSVILSSPSCRSTQESPETTSTSAAKKGNITITIVYDNNPGPEGLIPAWGFACIIHSAQKTILFDTGGDGRILLGNMRQLKIDPEAIDAIVLSHIHGDHTGGLPSVLQIRPGVAVYIPTGFPAARKRQIQSLGGQPIEAEESELICDIAQTTGTLGKGAIEEQGLCIKCRDGWVLITGCAHPGVANMAAEAKRITNGPIHLVMGGFHMGRQSKSQIEAVIDRFEKLGVQQVAPCHRSGPAARKLFKQRFGARCDLPGVGSTFRFEAEQ